MYHLRYLINIFRFWKRGQEIATVQGAKDFVDAFSEYLESVVQESELRDTNTIPTIPEYVALRLRDVGAKPVFAMCKLCVTIPEEVSESPLHKKLCELCCELVAIDNVSSR